MFQDRSNHHDFLSLVRQLSPPGEITSSITLPFEFLSVDKPYESYNGINVGLRFIIIIIIIIIIMLLLLFILFINS